MEVFTIDLILNLILPLVILTHVTTRNFESTDSSILNLLHTNTLVCDSENPLKTLNHQLCMILLHQLQIYRFYRCVNRIPVVTLKGEDTTPFRSQKRSSKVIIKRALGFPLNTRRIESETLIT